MTEDFSDPRESFRQKYADSRNHGSSAGKKSRSSDTKGIELKSVLIGFDQLEAGQYPVNLFYPEPEMEDAVSPSRQEFVEESEADMQMYCDHTIMEESNEYLETARSNLTQELKT